MPVQRATTSAMSSASTSFLDHRAGLGVLRYFGLQVGDFVLGFAHLAVADFGHASVIAVALGLGRLHCSGRRAPACSSVSSRARRVRPAIWPAASSASAFSSSILARQPPSIRALISSRGAIASRSISSCRTLRSRLVDLLGNRVHLELQLEPHASSIRSIALSGRKRDAGCSGSTASTDATIASSLIRTLWWFS